MTISAKYPGTCSKCNGAITPGQKIEWTKGSRPTHTSCGAPTSAAKPGVCKCGRAIDPKYSQCYSCANPGARSSRGSLRGKWTGCACGSIEGTPRKSDCATCRFDNE